MRMVLVLALLVIAPDCEAQDIVFRLDEQPAPTTFAGLEQLRGPAPSGPCTFPSLSLSVDSLRPVALADSASLLLPTGWQTRELNPNDDEHTRTRLAGPGDSRVLIERQHNGASSRPFLMYGIGERPEGMTCSLARGQMGAIWTLYLPNPQDTTGVRRYTALGSIINPAGFWYSVTLWTSSAAYQSQLAAVLTELLLLPSPTAQAH
jgi:hypothetical protein